MPGSKKRCKSRNFNNVKQNKAKQKETGKKWQGKEWGCAETNDI